VVPFIALISSMSFFENISAIHEASVDCFEELLFGKKSYEDLGEEVLRCK